MKDREKMCQWGFNGGQWKNSDNAWNILVEYQTLAFIDYKQKKILDLLTQTWKSDQDEFYTEIYYYPNVK